MGHVGRRFRGRRVEDGMPKHPSAVHSNLGVIGHKCAAHHAGHRLTMHTKELAVSEVFNHPHVAFMGIGRNREVAPVGGGDSLSVVVALRLNWIILVRGRFYGT